MKRLKLIFVSTGLLAGLLIIIFVFPNVWGKSIDSLAGARSSVTEELITPSALSTQIDTSITVGTKPPQMAAISSPSPIPSRELSLLNKNEYTFTQTVDSVDVRLLINWFYIDEGRVNLEAAVCGLPMPVGFKPVYIIDPTKIKISQADGTPISLVQRNNFGGGGGGTEDQVPNETESCYRQT